MARFHLLALALLAAVAVVTASSHSVVESFDHAPYGWKATSRAEPDSSIRLVIALHQTNLDQLERTLLEVSDPRSTSYGRHWSNDAIHALVAPKRENVDAVLTWLSSHGVDLNDIESTSNYDFIRVSVKIAQAERLLHAKYFNFAHKDSGKSAIRTLAYKVPAEIAKAIDIIGPTVRFPSTTKPHPASVSHHVAEEKRTVHNLKKKLHGKHTHHKSSKVGSGPDPSVCLAGPSTLSTTPACMRALYNVGNYTAQSTTNSSVGVSAFQQQFINPSDLAAFFQQYDPTHARAANIVGQNDWQDYGSGSESILDIEYSMGMSPGVPGTFWYDNTTDEIDFNLDFLYQLSAATEVPWVFSDSYGVNEEVHTGPAMDRFNVEFQKLGLRGLSLLFAMGDGGVGGGSYPALDNCTVFIPAYPTSPYVTTVGGTDGYQPEAAWTGSSGGFSNYYPAPDYQLNDISNYKTKYASSLPPAANFNQTGRGFPDVSAQSTNFAIYQNGAVTSIGGTSASSPSFAGLVALLNDMRLSAGKSTLGFLNVMFYQNPQLFQDVTTGNNPGCNSNGFYAQPGWDPVTGLGTPNFQLMADYVMSLP